MCTENSHFDNLISQSRQPLQSQWSMHTCTGKEKVYCVCMHACVHACLLASMHVCVHVFPYKWPPDQGPPSALHLDFMLVVLKGLHHHQGGLHLSGQAWVVAIEAIHATRHVHHQTDSLRQLLRRAQLKHRNQPPFIDMITFFFTQFVVQTMDSSCGEPSWGMKTSLFYRYDKLFFYTVCSSDHGQLLQRTQLGNENQPVLSTW